MMHRFRLSLMLAITAVAVSITQFIGCASPPGEQFYTLTSSAVQPAKAPQPDALVISIGAISLPEQVDRPQIVTLDGQQRVSISEQHRWAASLQSQIGQVLASSLAQRLDTPLVISYPQPEPRSPDIRVTLSIQRFDAQPGQEVVVDALWSARSVHSDQIQTGHESARVSITSTGDDYAVIAAAYRVALEQISEQVVEGIWSIQKSK